MCNAYSHGHRSGANLRAAARVAAVALLLALVCRAGLAQIGPRYAIELKAGGTASAEADAGGAGVNAGAEKGGRQGQGRVRLAGKGLALIRYQGLTILVVSADADAYSAEAVREWPLADLLVLTPAAAGRYSGLAPLAALRGMPVVLPEAPPSASAMMVSSVPPVPVPLTPISGRADGPRFHPMQAWDALHLRKGTMRLRLTALPGPPGTSHVAGFMLDMGDARASYRVYVSCDALSGEEVAALPQRLPGADLALLADGGEVRLAALGRARLPGKPAATAALTAAGYRFVPLKR